MQLAAQRLKVVSIEQPTDIDVFGAKKCAQHTLQLHQTTSGLTGVIRHYRYLLQRQEGCCLLQMAGITCTGSDLDRMSAAQQFLLQYCKVCSCPDSFFAAKRALGLLSVEATSPKW